MDYYSKSAEETLSVLSLSGGLNDRAVKLSKEKFGINELPKPKKKTLFKRILSALAEPMIIILLVSLAITFCINLWKFIKTGDADFIEVVGILLSIALSTMITLIMEGSSSKAFLALTKIHEQTYVKVIRNGKVKRLLQSEIVVGDIIKMETGDKVVADGRLIESNSLSIDESALTGESQPSSKNAELILEKNSPLAERKNMVYSGTFVIGGEGKCVVTGVGKNTEIGKVAKEIGRKKETQSPLQEKLNSLSKKITIIGASVSALVFIVTIIRLSLKGSLNFFTAQDAFISCIVLIVASVPEGLPAIVAVSLALNMIKLTKSNVLIKKLIATETTGAVSVICSDKTGTLTENKMKVVKICTSEYCVEPERVKKEVMCENFCINSTADIIYKNGKPTYFGSSSEGALLMAYREIAKGDYVKVRKSVKIVKRTPFSSQSKVMETTFIKGGTLRRLVKGAPEVVLKNCDLTDKEKEKIIKRLVEFESQGKRVLCFAHVDGFDDTVHIEKLTFDGFSVIADTIRKDVKNAVKSTKKAGIDVKMLTGDNLITATAIAKELGIISSPSESITASEIEKLTDEELSKKIDQIKVIARSTPMAKLRVVKVLKSKGEVVAVTGDGINDAPAIKQADVGIAMGINGSDVTKEASDVILLDDSFSTLVKAIEFGRNVYSNLQRFILFQLSVNVSALMIIVACLLFNLPQPFSTLQLLWINVIMDGPPALTLGLEGVSKDTLLSKPVKRSDGLVKKKMLFRILLHSTLIAVITILEYKFDFLKIGSEYTRSVVFTLFITFQLFNAFNSRELGGKSIFKSITKNKIMLLTFSVTFLLQIILVNFLHKPFMVTPMPLTAWLKTIALAFSVVVFSETYKLIYRVLQKRPIINNKKGVIA